AYRLRSFAIKKLRAENGGEQRYLQWMAMSLLYLEQESIAHAQLALGEDEIRAANAVTSSYNTARSTQYKLLAHTSAVYGSDSQLERELTNKLLPLFKDATLTEVVGIDLLGSENKVGNYAELFAFLAAQIAQPNVPLTQYFGAVASPRALQFVNHIHCGEGMGVAADNRSAIGYAMAYSSQLPDASFYRAYADYIATCLAAAQGRQADQPRGSAGAPALSANRISGLFDELFRNDSLTVGGLTLRRYDGNSERTRELVAYAGKRNMMALCESLDLPSAPPAPPPPSGSPPVPPPESYYALLSPTTTLLSFRLGHAYYYRSFVAARYPTIAFDTNLGSNVITGASGLFASVEDYRINRGFRHLDGYIDTDLLAGVTDTVMFTGLQALSVDQINQLMTLARTSTTLPLLFTNGQAEISAMLSAQTAPIISTIGVQPCYQAYQALATAMIGESQSRSVWFAALARALNLFVNWRCYLLGSDAQGVEHTDIQDEFLRSVLLLAYSLVPFDSGPGAASVGPLLQQLVGDVAAAYWQSTIGPLAGNTSQRQTTATIVGYKAPASVVTVTRSAAPA
ncbi:MAG: hypothetical protein ACREP7_04770, partial [Lysobacter sp.]